MKKVSLFFMAMVASFALQAQWTDNPANNNFIANALATDTTAAGGIHPETDAVTGDTYVLWNAGGFESSDGYALHLQRLTADGTPQWGADGICMPHHFNTWSAGRELAITTDHAAVACFAAIDNHTYAVKVNPDGTFPWGEQGVTLFDGQGESRAEVIAGNDGGCWTLGFARPQLYLQYVNADGTLNPTAVIETGNDSVYCAFGKLTLGNDNNVFLTYETIHDTTNTFDTKAEKQIHLRGYATDGTQITPDVTLMATQYFEIAYYHRVIPDGLGGAYAYLARGDELTANVYVYHYDVNGNNTISDTLGIPVHDLDQDSMYISPRVTVDPVSHDLLIGYYQTDAAFQRSYVYYVNRITTTGEKVWGNGIKIADLQENKWWTHYVNAFEDGSGFSITYMPCPSNTSILSTVEAMGLDMNCNVLWNKQLSSSKYYRSTPDRLTGFHNGQNIVVWSNNDNGNLYGQNFGVDGSMGHGVGVEENVVEDEEIVTLVRIINVNGQTMTCKDENELTPGIYILQGTNKDGMMVNKKTIIIRE